MFKKTKNKVLAIIVSLAVMMLPMFGGNVIAKTLPQKDPFFTDVTDKVKQDIIETALNSENIKNLKEKYIINTTDTNKFLVKKLPESYDLTAISIPINDNTGYNYSKYMAFYNSKGELANWELIKFTKKDNIYNMHIELKGGVTADVDANENGEIIEGSVVGLDGVQKNINELLSKSQKKPNVVSSLLGVKSAYASTGIDCVISCLTNTFAFPSWLLGLMATACAVACVATAGLGCYLCLTYVTFGYGYEIGYCLRVCGYQS